MAIIMDTGLLIAKHSRKDANRARAMEIVAAIAEGEHGTPYISDFVLTEAVNYAIGRSKSAQMALDLLDDALGVDGPAWLVLVPIDERLFAAAVDFFRGAGASRGLSLTDCTSVALARALRVRQIASFDGGFDGFLDRLC